MGRNPLGEFLKARRREVQPEDVGLPMTGRRRTAGLRREEVAALASINTDYYTRIEQGRRIAPPQTMELIADVLGIDRPGREYMADLVAERPVPRPERADREVSPGLQRMIDAMPSIPGIVLGRQMDILAWNTLAERLLLTDFEALADRERNYARLIFTDRQVQSLYGDWESTGRLCVHLLHMDVAKDTGERRLSELVDELSALSDDFRAWWGEHQVRDKNSGRKVFHHPSVGRLELDWETLVSADNADQRLVIWTAPPHSVSAARLLTLTEL